MPCIHANSVLLWRIPAILTAVYAAALLVGTHWPLADQSLGFKFSDKILHMGAYAGLAVLCRLTWLTWPSLASRQQKTSFFLVFLLTLGAIDELTQIPVTGRRGTIADWIADGIGITLGLLLVHWLTSGKQRGHASRPHDELRDHEAMMGNGAA